MLHFYHIENKSCIKCNFEIWAKRFSPEMWSCPVARSGLSCHVGDGSTGKPRGSDSALDVGTELRPQKAMCFWRALHFFCLQFFQRYHGEMISILSLSKDIVGLNWKTLIKYSKLRKNKSTPRAWRKEWNTLVCLEIPLEIHEIFVPVWQMRKSSAKDRGMRSHRGYWTGPQGKASRGTTSGHAN